MKSSTVASLLLAAIEHETIDKYRREEGHAWV
jgi:hypothetical protein